jgi:SAM-dependent methyltransferase
VTALVCPRDAGTLERDGDRLVCRAGHRYPVDGGVPILLVDEAKPTQPGYWATRVEEHPVDELEVAPADEVDPYVRRVLLGTCGNLYGDASRIKRYPLPMLPLSGPGAFLELGANWGRWTIAAARAGFDATGIDPSLGATRAAKRVARQLGVDADYVVADARHLPFADASIDVVFSYSVLQHFGLRDVEETLHETARVLKPGGISLHQLTNAFGARNVYQQARRRFRAAEAFDVRYWRPADIQRTFEAAVGPTTLSADGFLTLNPHADELAELAARARFVVHASRALVRLSEWVPGFSYVADSLWVCSTRR